METARVKLSAKEVQSFLSEVFPQIADGMRVERVGPFTAEVRLLINEQHLRPGGTVSGPTLFAAADLAMYVAVLAMIGPEPLTVTTNCSIDFLRKPAAGRDLLARARILKLGRTLAVGDVLVFSEGHDEPVARAGLTYIIPPQVR